jgi:hypothetical protein
VVGTGDLTHGRIGVASAKARSRIMTVMNNDARRAVVAALLQLAESRDYRDRADAGQAMAAFSEIPEARQPLQQLLLDAADTFVTLTTAEALLRRNDAAGLTAVAVALAEAGSNHADWIHTAVHKVFTIYASERDGALRTCDALLVGADQRLHRGALQLRRVLAAINPVLHPAEGRRGVRAEDEA